MCDGQSDLSAVEIIFATPAAKANKPLKMTLTLTGHFRVAGIVASAQNTIKTTDVVIKKSPSSTVVENIILTIVLLVDGRENFFCTQA